MEAGMGALTSIEAPVRADEAESAAGVRASVPAPRRLRLLAGDGQDDELGRVHAAPVTHQPRSSSISGTAREPRAIPVLTPSAVIAPRPRAAAQAPLRLTRRGRALVVGLVVAVIAAAALFVSLAAAGGAQAANHGQSGGGGYQGMHEIVVRPGQTLWSIASAAEPGADPRVVVQQIMSVNAMTSTDISAGQLLWVPR
jgi:LysM domain